MVAGLVGGAEPTPHVYRLVAARGRELDLDEVRTRSGAVAAVAPNHRFVHNQMIQSLAPKWGGSNDDMFEFARTRAATAEVVAVIGRRECRCWWVIPNERP